MTSRSGLDNSQRRILLTYSVPRSGHAQVAAALRQELELSGGWVVDEFNLLDWMPRVGRLLPLGYRWVMRYLPAAWRYFHGHPGYGFLIWLILRLARSSGFFGLLQRIQAFQPDVIVATHFFQTQALGEARRLHLINTPVWVLPTDYGAHPFWAHAEIERYAVACDEVKLDLEQSGVETQRISVTGLPVKQEILHPPTKLEVYQQYSAFDPSRPHVLILGGSYGLFPFQDLVREVLRQPDAAQIQWLVVFGGNDAARARAIKILRDARQSVNEQTSRILIFGFEPLAPFLCICDVALAKPGGSFVSEALASGLPLIIHQALPGQEERNTHFLLSHRAALYAPTPHEAVQAAITLLRHARRYQSLKQTVQSLAQPLAGAKIVDLLDQRYATPV